LVTRQLRFASNELQVELLRTDRVLELRKRAFQWVSGLGVTTPFQCSDLVLSLGDQVLSDGICIGGLGYGAIIIIIPCVFVRFKYEVGAEEPQVFQGEFGMSATIREGKEYVSVQIKRPPGKITLLFRGRELQDTQKLSLLRLQSESFVMIWVDEPTPVLIQSMKCLHIPPKPITFKVLEYGEMFQIEFLGGDLIDHVRVRVANRFSCDPALVQLWFTGHELLNDVMIDAIRLGDDDFIGIQIPEFGTSTRIASAGPSGEDLPVADAGSLPASSSCGQGTPDESELTGTS
jgi:hypothetical protein